MARRGHGRRADDLDDMPQLPLTRTGAKGGGRLRNEIVGPIGLGTLVLVAVLGLIAGIAAKAGAATLVLIVGAAGSALAAALIAWVMWIVQGSAARPLSRLGEAMQRVEEGDYSARLEPAGALELRELALGFNRMATIVGHQRERLKRLAATDPLTGLANHRHFHERLRAELQACREADVPVSVVALDIDGFKLLNDQQGHSHGDEALQAAAEALTKAVREKDLVGRLGSDDFVLLLHGADSPYAREVADRARDALSRCLPDEPRLTISAGFVCYPEYGEDGSLTELATSALDVAKRAGGGQTRKYDPEQVARIPTIKQQRGEIDSLLEKESPITTVFQPLVELSTGRLIGYEALSRFNSDVSRPPDAWFNQAHACGRGVQLEAAAIEAALSFSGRPEGTYLSLNFSPSAIASAQVLRQLPQRLHGVVIEVTEHELAAEDGALEEGLERLRARGARIAVDDAGAGYAGLGQVMRVQPDLIKLDRSLVEGVHADSAKAALIEFFVLFARRVGAGVCTEGIETLEELRALVNLGVNYGQGYLLGRPAQPWADISPEIVRALATGALRTHVQGAGAAPLAAVAAAPAPPAAVIAPPLGPMAPQGPAGGAGSPVNRRLDRYQKRRF